MFTGFSGEVFHKSDCRPFEFLAKPLYWDKYALTVIADRMLPDGTRQHIVKEDIESTTLDNAQVFSENYYFNNLEHTI